MAQPPTDTRPVDARIDNLSAPDTGRGNAILALLRLVRIEYAVSGALGVFLGAYLSGGRLTASPVLLSAAAVLFIAMGCYAFDDLADLECDRHNQRADRPLLSGDITTRTAQGTGVISFVMALITLASSSALAGMPIVLGAGVALVYNKWLQGLCPLKNVLFAGVFPTVLLIGLLAAEGSLRPVFLYVVALMFVAGLGFETMIDIADIDGDRTRGVASFATRYGGNVSALTAAILFVAAGILALLLFFLPLEPRLWGDLLYFTLAIPLAAFLALTGVELLRDFSPHRVLVLKRYAFLAINSVGFAIAIGMIANVH